LRRGPNADRQIPGLRSFGMDPDLSALCMGRDVNGQISFVCAQAEALPYASGSFDLVVARVSLPYTNIGKAIGEIRRVLRPEGRVWLLLHPLRIPLRNAWRTGSLKAWCFFCYIVVNGAAFHFFQRQFSFWGHTESFQTARAMRFCMQRNGFEIVRLVRGAALAVTARTVT
jgi:ubiquinone/menaquinone biosynthesis C-methylase UbiE